MAESTWLIVGLGNPGPRYEHTRHNVGAMVALELAKRHAATMKHQRRLRADVAQTRVGEPPGVGAVVATLRSYMNESGGPVAALSNFYKVPAERVVIIHDELDLPFGGLRVKRGGGDNGHNGLRSVRAALSTGEYYRVRVGVGRPPGQMDAASYVLKPFAATEREHLGTEIARAADAVCALVVNGLEYAQNHFNS